MSLQMRGGGVIHGPVVRSHEHSLNRKVRRLGMKCALAVSGMQIEHNSLWSLQHSRPVEVCSVLLQAKTLEGRLHVFDSLSVADAKTVRRSLLTPLVSVISMNHVSHMSFCLKSVLLHNCVV